MDLTILDEAVLLVDFEVVFPVSANAERELEATIEYAALRARGNEILDEDLPVKFFSEEPKENTDRDDLRRLYGDLPNLSELEKRYLQFVLLETNGNKTKAAEILGIDRRTLYRMMERYGVTSE